LGLAEVGRKQQQDPLDLWFQNLPAGSVIPAFSIGYSVGMAKWLSTSRSLHGTLPN